MTRVKRVGVIVISLVAIGISLFFVVNKMRSDSLNRKTYHCASDAPGKALEADNTLLEAKNISKLEPVAGQILTQEDHDQSPTCMYVLTKYYINKEQATEAQSSYDKLKMLVSTGKKYGTNIRRYDTNKDLETLIKGVVLRQAEFKSHTLLTPTDSVPK